MNLPSVIEALLFVAGESIKIKKLVAACKASEDEVRMALSELMHAHEERKDLRVILKDDDAELTTHPENSEIIAEYMKSGMEEDLTDATAETLAIVAYKGPIVRAAIDDIRGVNSQYTLRTLLLRGLVERLPNPNDARTYLYRISFDFLKKLGLQNVGELTEFETLSHASLSVQKEEDIKGESGAEAVVN